MRGIALLKVVSAAALLLQASAQSLKELLSAPFAGTESSADGVSTPPDAAAAPTTPRKKGRCTNQDRECEVDDDCNFKKAWRAAYGIGTCQGGEGRRRRRKKRTPAPVALNAPTPSPTPRPTPRPTVDAAERKAAATRRCAASARRPVVDAGALDVLLVVPGLLDAGRVQVARRNWAMLRPRACIVPTWQRCGDDPDLDEAIDGPVDGEEDGPRLPYLSEACDVPRVPTKGTGGYVAQLKFVLPAHVQALGVRWVFVVLDDVRLFAGEFDAKPFFRIAARNNLDVASPAIRRAHSRRFPEMRPRQLTNGAVGRRVAKVELFATAFTRDAYHCFHDLADVEMNAEGYGYPDWLPGYCSLRGEKFAAGVVDVFRASHGLPGRRDAWTKSYSDSAASRARKEMAKWYATRGVQLVRASRNVTGFLYDSDDRPSSS